MIKITVLIAVFTNFINSNNALLSSIPAKVNVSDQVMVKRFNNDINMRNSFIIDSSFFMNVLNSNRGFGEFYLSYNHGVAKLYNIGENFFKPQKWYSKLLYLICFNSLTEIFNESLMLSYHEWGHASRIKAFDLNYTFLDSNYKNLGSNFFGLFLQLIPSRIKAMFSKNVVGAATEIFPNPHNSFSSNDIINKAIVITAGGLNNQTKISKIQEDQIWFNGIQEVMFINSFYILNKIYTSIYASIDNKHSDNQNISGDTSKLLTLYNSKIENLSIKNLQRDSIFSCILSASTYAYYTSIIHYIFYNGNGDITSINIKGIRIPDVNYFLTSFSPSYQITSGYKINPQQILGVSFEWLVYKIDNDSLFENDKLNNYELSLSYRHYLPQLNNGYIHAESIINNNAEIGGSIKVCYNLNKKYFIEAGYVLYNRDTLYGERNSLNLLNKYSHELWMSVGIRY